jgi:hypothetical protein
MASETKTDDMVDPLREVANAMPHEPVAPAHGIAAIALSMAMKYHDIATVQDGTLYQQYKLEGKNMQALHLDMVFDTAIQIERHLLASSSRIAGIVVEALQVGVGEDSDEQQPEDAGPDDTLTDIAAENEFARDDEFNAPDEDEPAF